MDFTVRVFKHHEIMKKAALALCLVCCTLAGQSQNTHKDSDYKKHPYWIEMIKDPHVNYFEAIKAYDLFWKGKAKPEDEDELIGQDKSQDGKAEAHVSRREIRERRREKEMRQKYGLDCKKFEHWKMQVKPYVQADGHILSKEEQLKLWEQQRQQ